MIFRTPIKPLEHSGILSHKDGIMMLGSCFSDNIGDKLKESLFDVDVNPFGTTYNPESISLILNRIISLEKIEEKDLFFFNGLWSSFFFHSRFSGTNREKTVELMNKRITQAHQNLKKAHILFITFGTAYKYSLIESGITVNNCHKIPNAKFSRTMLGVTEISTLMIQIIKQLKEYNSNLKIIFTVSPIRHIADGLSQNQLSKCTLRVAINDIINNFPEDCSYFPAFEIMMDDLRDYRFYTPDMVHPSEVAIEYIWKIFQSSYCDESTIDIALKCLKLNKRLSHRPITENKEAMKEFNDSTQKILQHLILEFPYLKDRI